MDRGPLALFGAIVAVGVGPALWMGVQLGAGPGDSPARPPVVSEQGTAEKPGQSLLGGAGAGEETRDNPVTEPRANVRSLKTSATPSPSASSESEASPSTTIPATAEPTRTTDEPELPPTESTTAPTGEPTETAEPPAEEETAPPSPPAEDEPTDLPDYAGSAGYAGERSGK